MKAFFLLLIVAAGMVASCSTGHSVENVDQGRPQSAAEYVKVAVDYMKEARRTGEFGLNDKAQAAVAQALELSPNDIPARKLEASLHLAHHRFAEAIDAAEK